MSYGSAPPLFADEDKFDSTNWVAWSRNINIAVQLKGATGYLDGTIKNPSTPKLPAPPPSSPKALTSITTTETNWESLTPTLNEWNVWNAWVMALLIYNTKNPVGLGINMDGSAANAWKSYKEGYEEASDMARQHAEHELRSITFSENDDFPTFIADMRVKWARANALGATISDSNFKTIIITALPQSWDPIVASLLRTMTSIEAVAQLNTWWLRVSRHRPTNSVKAFQIN